MESIKINNELIINGRGGYRVLPKDVDAYVKRIEELSLMQDRRRKMGRWNCEKAEKYKESESIKIMKDIYQ